MVLSISGLFSAILASFSSNRVPSLKTLILLRNTRELGGPVLKVAKSVHSVTTDRSVKEPVLHRGFLLRFSVFVI